MKYTFIKDFIKIYYYFLILFNRILTWIVKLADRIVNLQKPPYYWTKNKTEQYRDEAIEIHKALGSANEFLSSRLLSKIKAYEQFVK